jgi:hypothetical protein
MQNTNTSPPVKLAELALELGLDVDAIEQELGADVFRHGGFRCCTAFRAAELIAAHDRRKAEAAAAAERRAEEAEAKREATRARAIAERRNTDSRVQKLGLQTIEITQSGPAGVLPVTAMTAAADKDFDGGTVTPRLSRLDWLLGRGDSGGVIGPTRKKKKGA